MGKFIKDQIYLLFYDGVKLTEKFGRGTSTGYGPKAGIWTNNTIKDRQETLGNTTTTILRMSTISIKGIFTAGLRILIRIRIW